LVPKGQSFRLPRHAKKGDVVHEIELGVMLKKGGKDIKHGDWKSHIGAYFLLLDYSNMTEIKRA
jgi:2-keto-4-pentenoate hydratase/2-oxohepta-3-ene-1,7-dioic acid hydratase in catechol pathway